MLSPRHARFRASALLLHKTIWPYGIFEVVVRVIEPLINRIVFLVILLSVFKRFAKKADELTSVDQILASGWPILVGVAIAIIIPSTVQFLRGANYQKRAKKMDTELIKKYNYILYGTTQVRKGWNKYYRAQRTIFEYIVFDLGLIIFFSFFSVTIALVYITCTLLFIFVGTRKERSSYIGSVYVNPKKHISFLANVFLGVYLISCGITFLTTLEEVPLELLVVLVIGARMQFGKASKIVRDYHSHLTRAAPSNG